MADLLESPSSEVPSTFMNATFEVNKIKMKRTTQVLNFLEAIVLVHGPAHDWDMVLYIAQKHLPFCLSHSKSLFF